MGILSHRLAFLLATQASKPGRMEIQDFYENADEDFILSWKKVAGETKFPSEVNAEEIARLVTDLGSLKNAASVLPRVNKNIIAEGPMADYYEYAKEVRVYQEGFSWSPIVTTYSAWRRKAKNADFLVNPSMLHALGSGDVKPSKVLFMEGVEEGPIRLFAEDENNSKKNSDSHFGYQFERLVTCLNAVTRKDFEACMETGSKDGFSRVRLFTFGKYTVLVSNEIDAINDNGEVVEIKAGYMPNLEKGFKLGSQMLLAGAKKLIHSVSQDRGFVKGVREYNVEDVLAWGGKDNQMWQTFHDNIGISLGKLRKAFLERNNEDPLFFKLSQLKGDSVAVEVLRKHEVDDGALKTSKRAMESKATVAQLRQLALKYVETGASPLGHGARPNAVLKQSFVWEDAQTKRNYKDVNSNSARSSYRNGNNNYYSDSRGGGSDRYGSDRYGSDRYGSDRYDDRKSRSNDHWNFHGSRHDRLRGNRARDSCNDSYGSRSNDSYGSRSNGSYGSRSNVSYGSRSNDSYGSRSNDSYGSSSSRPHDGWVANERQRNIEGSWR